MRDTNRCSYKLCSFTNKTFVAFRSPYFRPEVLNHSTADLLDWVTPVLCIAQCLAALLASTYCMATARCPDIANVPRWLDENNCFTGGVDTRQNPSLGNGEIDKPLTVQRRHLIVLLNTSQKLNINLLSS